MPSPDSHSSSSAPAPRLRFGLFELDVSANELTKSGRPVNIQGLPLRLIAVLAQKHPEVVTRDQMRQWIWEDDTFVDFESGLRTALRKARQALGDDAANPRFIETLPRQGFRFLAPVTVVEPQVSGAPPVSPVEVEAPVLMEPPVPKLPEVVAAPKFRLRTWMAVPPLLLVLVAVWLWYITKPRAPVLNRMHPFAAASGHQNRPAFSPNGEYLAFDWRGPHDEGTAIYVQKLDASGPVRMTSGPGDFRAVWSSDGNQIAFLRPGTDTYSILSVNLVDRQERHLADFPKASNPWFDWSRDGKWFAVSDTAKPGANLSITLISAADGSRHPLTTAPAGWHGDSQPVFSPDGSQIAFRRTTNASGHEDIYVVPTGGGAPQRWTFDDRGVGAYTFTPGGGLLFSSRRSGTLRSLWWVGPGGRGLTQVTAGTVDSNMPAISHDGARFAFSRGVYDVNVWRVATEGVAEPRLLVDSAVPDGAARLSPDGKRLVFQSDRSGDAEIWVSDADGSNSARLTNAHGEEIGNPIWSPDATRIAFEWHRPEQGGIYTIAPDGSGLTPVAVDSHQYRVPAWSHDGRFLYAVVFGSHENQIWRAPAQGGSPILVPHVQGMAPRESPDGQYLYFYSGGGVWRTPLVNGTPAQTPAKVLDGLLPEGDWGNWDVSERGIFYLQRHAAANSTIDYMDFESRAIRTVYAMPRAAVFGERGLSLSPDGKFLLFSQVDQDENQIFIQ